jgi:HlyD family secretion protein
MSGDGALFENVLASLSDGVVTISRDGRILTFNRAASEILGLRSEDVLGKPFAAVFLATGSNDEFIQAVLDAVYESATQHLATIPFVRGRQQLLLEIKTSFLQTAGRGEATASAIVAIFRDVTEVRKLEAAERNLTRELGDSRQKLADIIDFLPDPTFVIDTAGVVTTWNRAIEAITGVSAADMLGKGDQEYALPFYGEKRPLLVDLVGKPEEELQSRYAHAHPEGDVLLAEGFAPLPKGSGVWFEAAAAPLRDSHGHLVGAIETFRDSSRRKLAEDELKAKHSELQQAFLKIEETNEGLQAALKKVQSFRIAATIFIVLLFVGIGAYTTWGQFSLREKTAEQTAAPATPSTVRVQEAPLRDTLALTGLLRPLQVVNVTAPFSGTVAERLVGYGQAVEKGQVILRLDTREVQVKCRDAEIAVIKAEENLKLLQSWETGSEVSTARRSLSRAKMSVDAQRQARDEVSRLFEKGIVAATELENAKTQCASAEMDYETAKEALASALAKGGAHNQRIAELEAENARRSLAELKSQLALAEVTSPVSGTVIVPEAAGSDKQAKRAERGVSFTQGEVILSIGDTEGYSVGVVVDEAEVRKLKEGQKATVTGEAFPGVELNGSVAHVSTQAVPQGSGSRKSMFEATVSIPTPPQQTRNLIRLGMTAAIEILLVEKPAALLVPANAVGAEAGQPCVWRMDPASKQLQRVPVKTGLSTLDAVEILEGLKAGDEIAVESR